MKKKKKKIGLGRWHIRAPVPMRPCKFHTPKTEFTKAKRQRYKAKLKKDWLE